MIELATQRLPIESFVLENMSEGVIVIDEQGSIIFTNPAFDRMYGYPAGELNGRDVSILFPTLGTEENGFLSRIRPELQTVGVWQGEMTNVKKDGQHFWVRARFSLYIHEDQNYLIGLQESITKPGYEALKVGSKNIPIRKLLDVVPDTVEIFDPHTMEYLFWNEAVCKYSGYSDDEIAVMNATEDFIDAADMPRVNAAVERAMVEGRASVRLTVIHKDGTRIPMGYTAGVIKDDAGWPLYLVAFGRDIREQLRYEERINAEKVRYQDLVEKINDVIYAADSDGVITYVNPAVESLIGLPPEQVVGQRITRFIESDDLGKLQDNFQLLLSDMAPGAAEYRVLSASDETRWIRVTSQPIVEEEQVTGVQGVLTDITARKRIEEQLEETVASAERDRLARSLHDAITQTLFSASVIAEATPRVWPKDPAQAQRNMEQLTAMLRGAMAEMRAMVIELRPAAVSGRTLGELLETLIEANQPRMNYPISYVVEGDRILPEDVTIAFYRIAQEAFHNVVEHANATEVNIKVVFNQGGVKLSVRDNGRGFDQSKTPAGHFGLSIMSDRMANVGGNLVIERGLDAGTQVIASWSKRGIEEKS